MVSKNLKFSKRTQTIKFGSLSLIASTGVVIGVGLILAGLLARYFSPQEFGLWSIFMSLNGIFINGFDLGFGNALRNKLAQLYVRGEVVDSESRTYFFAVFHWFLLGGAVLSGIFLLVNPLIPWGVLFHTAQNEIIADGSSLMIAGSCLLALNIAFNLYVSGFFGYQESHWNALLNGLSKLTLLVLILGLVLTHRSFYFINLMFFLITLGVSVASFYVFLRVRRWNFLFLSPSRIWQKVQELWRKSAQFALLQIFSTFLLNADYFVISKILGLEAVGDYFIVKRIYLVLSSFHFAILLPIWSAYTESVESGDFAWVEAMLKKTILYTGFIFVLGLLLMVWQGNAIIYLWTGKEIQGVSLTLSLGVWGLVYGWGNCFSVFLNGIGNLRRQVILVIGGSIVVIPLSILLGERYGVPGVCASLIVVSLPAAISNPIEAVGVLKKFNRSKLVPQD